MTETSRSRRIAYSLAVLAPAVSLSVRWPLRSVLENSFPHMTFFPAIMIAAYLGGFWPGLLATALSAFAAEYFLPRESVGFQFTNPKDAIALVLFVLVGAVVSGLGELLRRERRRVVDITEHMRSVQALQESEQRWRNLTEALPQLVWTAAPDGTLDYYSTQLTEYTGRSERELLASGWIELLHPDDREHTLNSWIEARAQDRHHAVEHRIRRSDGAYRWFTTRGVPIRDKEGRIVKWFGTCTDITEHKQSEQALRESEQRWRSLTETLPQLVWTATPDGACDYFSTQWTQFTGVPEIHLLGWQWMETLHPDDREPTRKLWMNSVAGRGPYDVEYRVRCGDGEYRWFKTRGVPIPDAQGRTSKWFGTCTDITDGKRAQEALRESEEQFRGTFENAAVGITHCDAQGRLLLVNEKYCEIVGYSREELRNRTIKDQSHPDDLAATLEKYHALIRGELSSYMEEKRDIRKDGSVVWIDISVSLQRDAQGSPLHTICFVQDISMRKRLEEELRQAMKAAESANRAKDEFLANVSHEIRTPMNAILGMTDLVLGTSLTDDQRQCLKTVQSAAENLLGMINDLLDFSKIEAGKMELDSGNFSLRAALADTMRTLAVRAHSKRLELVSHVDPEVPDALVGDAGRLRQVLLNLVGNAIKFTNDGEVVLSVMRCDEFKVTSDESRVTSKNTGEGETSASSLVTRHSSLVTLNSSLVTSNSSLVTLKFTVRDTGIGIPHEKQETIFRAFEQEDTSTTRRYGGTGLGLTIAARLAALMSGTITVDSEPGQGSTFTFTACFGSQPHSIEPVAVRPQARLHDLPVLIVDDNATNRHILEEWLRGWQMEPVSVGDGVAAMDTLWGALSTGRPYPLMLLDARMPESDGLALAARIRERTALCGIRIILLTSGERPGDLARSRELRIDAHLLKPVQPDELLETIYRVMDQSTDDTAQAAELAPVPEPNPETHTAISPLNILVAEDNEYSARFLERLLTRPGHKVQLATNGREALNMAEGKGIDLLLLDVHMPEMDGFEVVQAIRQRERTLGGHLPIIALTARSRTQDRQRCLAAGMDDFLTKPIRPAGLLESIERLVSAHRSLRANEEQTDERRSLLDPAALLTASGDDAVWLRGMCEDLRTYLPAQLAELGDALRDRDAPHLREVAHKLISLLAAFSTVAGNVASELEDQAAAGRLEQSRPLVEQLEIMAQQLLRLVDGLTIDSLRRQTGRDRLNGNGFR